MLKAGDNIQGKLIEEVEKDRWIVSFQGQLLQVSNTTNITFQKNKTLNLLVVRIIPLELKVLESARKSFGFRAVV